MKVEHIDLSQIEDRTFLKDRNQFIYENSFIELTKSIKEKGLLQPICLMKKNDSKYEIIFGRRRFYAFLYLSNMDKNKYTKIPAIVIEEGIEKSKLAEYIYNENEIRQNINKTIKKILVLKIISLKMWDKGHIAIEENIENLDDILVQEAKKIYYKARAIMRKIEQGKNYTTEEIVFLKDLETILSDFGLKVGTLKNYISIIDLPKEIFNLLQFGIIKRDEAMTLKKIVIDEEKMKELEKCINKENYYNSDKDCIKNFIEKYKEKNPFESRLSNLKNMIKKINYNNLDNQTKLKIDGLFVYLEKELKNIALVAISLISFTMLEAYAKENVSPYGINDKECISFINKEKSKLLAMDVVIIQGRKIDKDTCVYSYKVKNKIGDDYLIYKKGSEYITVGVPLSLKKENLFAKITPTEGMDISNIEKEVDFTIGKKNNPISLYVILDPFENKSKVLYKIIEMTKNDILYKIILAPTNENSYEAINYILNGMTKKDKLKRFERIMKADYEELTRIGEEAEKEIPLEGEKETLKNIQLIKQTGLELMAIPIIIDQNGNFVGYEDIASSFKKVIPLSEEEESYLELGEKKIKNNKGEIDKLVIAIINPNKINSKNAVELIEKLKRYKNIIVYFNGKNDKDRVILSTYIADVDDFDKFKNFLLHIDNIKKIKEHISEKLFEKLKREISQKMDVPSLYTKRYSDKTFVIFDKEGNPLYYKD